MLAHDNLTHVMSMLKTMDTREATVLRMRFGLDDHAPHFKEIGQSLGLTRSTFARSRPKPSANWPTVWKREWMSCFPRPPRLALSLAVSRVLPFFGVSPPLAPPHLPRLY